MESKSILKNKSNYEQKKSAEPSQEVKEKHKKIQEAINKNEMKKKVQQVETKIQKMKDPFSKEIPLRANNDFKKKESKALVMKKKEIAQKQDDDEDDNESLPDDEEELQERDKTCLELLFPCCFKYRAQDGLKERKETDLGETGSEFEVNFSDLTKKEKEERLRFLWHRMYLKARGGARVLQQFGELNSKIYLYGAAKRPDKNKERQKAQGKLQEAKWLIMPDSQFKKIWNMLVTVLLIYTAIFVPYRTAFVDSSTLGYIIFDTCIDTLFFTDVFVNFFSAFEKKDKTVEVRHAYIAVDYLKTWFLLDIMSCIPVQLMELDSTGDSSSASDVKLLRLARLPRLYRLIRILRLFKMLRLLKYNSSFKKLFEAMKMNSGIMRMLTVVISVFFLVHLMSCAWFLAAKFDDFNPDTWVVRGGYLDKSANDQYLAAFYWAFQTLTTVGFGDINAKTVYEKIIALIWMIFGVGFYSFTIGNLSQIISSIDTTADILNKKLAILQEFSKRNKLPVPIQQKIRRHLENNSKFLDSLDEQEKLLNDLPASLRSEVVKHTHGTIINKIHFFKDQNLDFLWAILPMLRPISIQAKDIIYSHGDHSDEVYFIQDGRVRLFTTIKEVNYPEVQIPFKAYGEGSYFGDSDIFSNDESKGREGTAIAETNCQIQVLIRKDLMQLMEDFEEVMQDMKQVGKEKHVKHEKMIKKVKLSYKKNSHAIYKNLAKSLKAKMGITNLQESTEMLFSEQDDISLASGAESTVMMKSQLTRMSKSEKKKPVDPATKELEELQREVSQQKDLIRQETDDLQKMQSEFRNEYEDTIGTFQSNMSLLSFHSDRIQKMFKAYAKDRDLIAKQMEDMKGHTGVLEQNTEVLEKTLDNLLYKFQKKD